MRKTLSFIVLLIVLVTACSREGNEAEELTPAPKPTPPQSAITLDSSISDFTTEGGSNTITFTSSDPWTANVVNTRADNWCTISPTSGGAGNAKITVTTTANDTPDDRSASIIIKAGNTQKTIKVSQKQKDALTVTASTFEVAAEGGEVKIEVKANINFEYTIEEAAKDWVTPATTRALKTSTLVFKVAENSNTQKREAKITIKSGEFSETVTIYQSGTEPTIVISKNEYVVSAEGEVINVEVKSNVDVSVELPADAGWITENKTRATSTNTYSFDIAASQEYEQRSADIRFTNKENNLSEVVKVIQAQKDAIVIAKDSYTVENKGGQIEIEIGHNVEFDVSIDVYWINEANTRAFTTETLLFNVDENKTNDNREGTIKFTSKDGAISQVVKVYQAQEDALIISKKDIVVSEESGTLSFEIQTNVDFKVSEPNVSWLRAVTTRGLTTHTLRYEYDANTGYDSREAQIVVTNTKNNKSETIIVTQTQKDAIVLAKESYAVENKGGQIEIEIGHNVEFDVAIDVDWINKVETRAFTTETLLFNVDENKTNDNREGTIKFTSKDGAISQVVKVCQAQETEIDPTAIPDNEIWYVMSDGSVYDVYQTTKKYGHQPFDAKVISNTYKNGYGVIKFDAPVTKINDHTFGNGWAANMTELYLPDCIEYIGMGAIHRTGLTTLHIPKNLKCVDLYGLNNLNLESFSGEHVSEDGRCVIIEDGFMPNYGNTQTPVKNYMAAFAPAGITEYTLPNNVEILGWYTFAWCPELRKITFNEGLKTILGDCFVDVHFDCEIILPSTLESLGSYAFSSCSGIKGFYGNEKFHTSDHLCLISEETSYTDPEKNGKWINRFVGYDITDYSIPEGIKGIENYSFDKMPNLKTVTLPSSLAAVGASAFNHCDNLEALYGECVSDDHKAIVFDTQFRKLVITKGVVNYSIPDDITSIGYCAFNGSPEIETITMGDQITHIEGYAFSGCPNLKTITLSAGLKDLSGCNAFLHSDNLETIYCRAIVPPLYYDNQMSEFPNLKIYVPVQSLALYQNNAGWSLFKKYFVGYKYDDLGEYDYYISSDFSQNGTTTTLQTATKGNGIDIVLMGDAYSDRQIADGTYKADMENLYDNLFTEEPYKSFKELFNVHYVNVVSATEGYEYGNTALDGFFGDGTYVGGNDDAVFDYALKAISEERMDEALLIVAMNSDNYAGTCYMYYPTDATSTYGSGPSVAYFPKGGDAESFAQLLHHEACGHGFAKLADEYAYEDMGEVPSDYVTQTKEQQANWGWWKNVDFTDNLNTIRWSKFINDTRYANDGLGAYEGGLTYWTGVWRPTENSIMRYNTGGFNAPSRESIYYRIHKLAFGDDWEYDYEDFVEYDAINRKAAASARAKSYKPSNCKPTHPPVIMNKSWKDAE
ncbi:MAG: leucine-rich repeat protein [Bacteroides sp.]|nr:leucine-rich repeat protein [Bacteroides sp.]